MSSALLPWTILRPRTGVRRAGAVLALFGLLVFCVRTGEASHSSDRLETFRELVRARLAPLMEDGNEPVADAVREIYALLDEEILENLNSGGPFASEAFLQERLEAFAESWGWGSFHIRRLKAEPSVWLASVRLVPTGGGGSVRFYVRRGDRYTVSHAVQRDASPLVSEMPATRSGASQLLVAWLGAPSGQGTSPLTLELLRLGGQTARGIWSSGQFFPDGLDVLELSLNDQEVVIRFPGRYSGRKLGCDGETDQVDRYRYDPKQETFVLASRTLINGWHQELYQKAVHPLLDALRAGNSLVLQELIPSAPLRQRLPSVLEILPVCDDAHPSSAPTEVRVPAELPSTTQASSPLTLLFRRSPRGWTLVDVKREE